MSKFNKLSRAEMKNVLGGVADSGGTCAAQGDGGGTIHNLSKEEAMSQASPHWCCDSCASASWYCPTGEFCAE